MSGSVNRVILVGYVGQDPEIRTFQSGGRVCNLSLATSERWKDRETGEKRERTEWHRVSIFNDGLVGVAERFVRKGSLICVEGRLETRKWQDQSGQDRYTTEVALRAYGGSLTLLGDPKGGGADRGAGRDYSAPPGVSDDPPRSASGDVRRSEGGAGGDFYDDDLPF